MAAPVIYILGGVIVRAATPAIGRRLAAAGFRKASPSIAGSKANITTATNKNIISLITRAIKGARTSTSGQITKPASVSKPKSLAEVRRAIKRNAEKVSSKKFGEKKLSSYGPVGGPKPKPKSSSRTNTPMSFSRAASQAGNNTTSEKPKSKAPSVTTKAPNVASKAKGKTVEEIRKTAAAAITEVERQDAAIDKMEAKYINSSVEKLKSSLRPKARPATVKNTLSAFEKAFKAARKAKKYSFPFRGKEYTTRYKEETVAEHKKKFPKKK